MNSVSASRLSRNALGEKGVGKYTLVNGFLQKQSPSTGTPKLSLSKIHRSDSLRKDPESKGAQNALGMRDQILGIVDQRFEELFRREIEEVRG